MPEKNENSLKITLEKELNLEKDFSPPSAVEWKTVVVESLKGKSFEKLVTQTYENIDLQPIYTKKDIKNLPHLNQKPGFPGYLRGTSSNGYLDQPWEICQEIPISLAGSFNKSLKHELQRGLTGINLLLDRATQKGLDSDAAAIGEVGKNGTAISTLDDFSTALANVDLEKYPLHINPGFSGLEILMMLNAFFKQQGKEITRIKGSITTDPLAYLVTDGDLPLPLHTIYNRMALITGWAAQHAPQLKTIGISGLPYHHAGADAVRELAFVLATAVEYIDQLLLRDVTIDNIAGQMRFTFGIGPFYFMEIAKLRAARILWSNIVEACGGNIEVQKMTIHARTSSYHQTRYDSYVNMLRTTTEAFSAVVAGVNSLHTNPFDEGYGKEDDFSRRLARNTQILLHQECHLDQLIDPAGGSYYVEHLTHEVARKAWNLFQEIETGGGMFKALEKGFPQEETIAVHEKRKHHIAQRKTLLVGINYSADVNEKKPGDQPFDAEGIYRVRSQYMKKFKKNREAKPKAEIEKNLSILKQLSESNSEELITAGTNALLAGASIGEVSKTLLLEIADTGEETTRFFETDSPDRWSQQIKPLRPCRAAEIFEELRDAVEIYKEKTGSAPMLFLATMGPLSEHKARADFSRAFFEIGGFEVIHPRLPQGQGFETPDAAVEAILQSKAPVAVICSTDEQYRLLVPPISRSLKEKKPGIILVLAGYPKDQLEMYRQMGIDEFIYRGIDAHQALSRILKQSGVLS